MSSQNDKIEKILINTERTATIVERLKEDYTSLNKIIRNQNSEIHIVKEKIAHLEKDVSVLKEENKEALPLDMRVSNIEKKIETIGANFWKIAVSITIAVIVFVSNYFYTHK